MPKAGILFQKLLQLLFPQRCIICHKGTSVDAVNRAVTDRAVTYQASAICPACIEQLPFNRTACRRCALPLPDDSGSTALCGRCLKQAPAFDYAVSAFRYEDAVVPLVQQLKFSGKISFVPTLAQQMADVYLAKGMDLPDCLLPVPLHNRRLRERGYNQSIELARPLARLTGLPLSCDRIIRCRHTAPQVGNRVDARRRNIRGAFGLKSPLEASHVLIIDDVVTTGSTVNELAKLLKASGVRRVGVLSLARAPHKT